MSEMQVKSLDYQFVRVQRSSETIWWPCVLFPSQDELQHSLSNQTTKNAVVILFAKTCRVGDVLPVAYLLGDHPPVVAHFITSKDEELLDFYNHFAKMGQKYKHDAKWCNAREAVMALLASDYPTNLGQSAFLDDVPSSPAYSIDTPSPENKKRSVAYEDITTVPGATVATMSSPASRQKTKTTIFSRNTVESMSSPESRVFNVEFVESASSPESSASRSLKFAKARLNIKLNVTDDWITAKDKFQKWGWRIITGKGMVKHYYVHYSLRAVESYKDLLKTYPDEEGKLWFRSEDSWKKYIKERYHWEEKAQQKEEQKRKEQKETTSKQARYLGPYPKNGDSWPDVMNILNAMGYDWLGSCFASRRLIKMNVTKTDLIKYHLDVKGTEWFEEEEEIKEYITNKYKWNAGTRLGDAPKRAGRGVYDRNKVKVQGGREERDQSKADQQSIQTIRSTRNLLNPLKGDSWPKAMKKLKALGYCWLKGKKTFVSPHLSKLDVTKGVLRKKYMHLKGIDWFESSEEVKNYAKTKYQWNESVSPDNLSEPGFQGMYDQTKPRRPTLTKTPFTKISVKKQPLKKRGRISKRNSPSVISLPKKVGHPTKKRGHEAIEETPSVNSSLSSNSAGECVQNGSKSKDNIRTQALVQNMSPLRSSPRKSRQSSVMADTSFTSTKYVNLLPAFKTVWPILRKHFGFRKVNRERCLLCLPGVDPDAVEMILGRNYFDKELDFRKYLCAYGLPKPTTELLDADKDVLQKWVKYAIVSHLQSASKVRMVEPLGGMQAWSLLQKIGFRYVGGKYILPGVQMKPKGDTSWTKLVKGKDFFEHMDGDDGYWKFLARFGIESFPMNNLDETERLQLELFLMSCPGLDCFEQTEPSEGDPIFVTKFLGQNSTPTDITNPSKETPERKAKKKLKLGRSPVQKKDNWKIEKNDLESNNGTKRQTRHAASVSSASVIETVNRKNNDAKKTSSKRTSDETKTQAPEVTNSTQNAKRARKEVAAESTMSAPLCILPEAQSTVREKLVCCQQVLHPNHPCESLAMVDSNDATTRAPYVKQIQSFLDNVVSTSGEYGEKLSAGETGKSPTLYVCGRTGTGKTTAVQNCCSAIIKERESEKGSNRESTPIVCYINVAHIFKANDATSQSRNEMLGKIGAALGMKTDSINTTQIDRKMKKVDGSNKVKPVLILILDEIDLIVTETNCDTQELLGQLLSWASSPSYCCALIGISNEIQLRRFKALEQIAQQLTFPTFKKAELIEIITERVGTSIIDPQAVKFVATTVERNCGDARKAMEVISDAVGKCMKSLSDEELLVAGNTQGSIVKMYHVKEAVKESNLPLNDKITNLPHAAKVVLCIAMEISKVSAYHDSIPIGLLKRMCNEASRQELFEDLAMEHFADLVQRLDDAGLLLSCIPGSSIIQQMGNKDNLYDVRISIGVQLEEVECALESTLLQSSFFARMKKHVENKYHS